MNKDIQERCRQKAKEIKRVVMYDSDDAAVYEARTLKGWWTVESTHNGKSRFWGEDEHMARYDGCTHKKCACGEVASKHYIRCEKCSAKKALESYLKLPEVEWDEITPIASDSGEFFFCREDLDDYCSDNECTPEELMLVLCTPNYLTPVTWDYWEGVLPDDDPDLPLPDKVQEALKELNHVIINTDPISWEPGKTRVRVL